MYMKSRKRLWAVLLAACLLLSGCGAETKTVSLSGPEEENRLTVYVSHKRSVYLPIVREFEDRTGIWVQVVSGGTNELLERIRSEQEAPCADVMFGGGVESLESYEDCFRPYISRESDWIRESYADPESRWTPFSALPVVLIYNTKLVDREKLCAWRDLLKPEFHGKIAFADPTVSGSSYTALITALMALKPLEDPVGAFVRALDGKLLPGSGDVIRAVSEGRALVGITLEETAAKAIAAGDHIGIVYPEEGTSCLPDGIALVAGGPHEENARRFLDFAVSRDVQSFLTSRECRRSVRTDASAAPGLPELGEIKVMQYDRDLAILERDRVLKSWQEKLEAAK